MIRPIGGRSTGTAMRRVRTLGPADLSASLGYRGKPGHPEVHQAIEGAITRIVRSGKAAGILT